MVTQTVEEVALNFMRHIVLQYGIPCSLVTDQGMQFMGDVFKRFCKLLRVHKLNTSAFRPSSNCSLERAYKTMVEYLHCFCDPRESMATICMLRIHYYTTYNDEVYTL
jgi:hypothetical protein